MSNCPVVLARHRRRGMQRRRKQPSVDAQPVPLPRPTGGAVSLLAFWPYPQPRRPNLTDVTITSPMSDESRSECSVEFRGAGKPRVHAVPVAPRRRRPVLRDGVRRCHLADEPDAHRAGDRADQPVGPRAPSRARHGEAAQRNSPSRTARAAGRRRRRERVLAPTSRPSPQAHRRVPHLRLGRTGRVLESLIPAVIEQRVAGKDAFRAWRLLVTKYGAPAPGPAPARMRVPPPAEVWRRIPSWEFHLANVDPGRARTSSAVPSGPIRWSGWSPVPPSRPARR